MTEECGASVPAAKGTPSIFRSGTVNDAYESLHMLTSTISPLPLAALMLAAAPSPRGSCANLAVAGFVVGTLSDQSSPSSHGS